MSTEKTAIFRKDDMQIRGGGRSLFPVPGFDITDIVLQIFLSVLSAWAFVHLFTTAFDLTVNEPVFILFAFALSTLMALLVRGRKAGIYILAAVIAVGIVFLILKWDKVVAECSGLYDRLITTFGKTYGFTNNTTPEADYDYRVTWIMICFAVIPIWQTSYTYGKKMYPMLLAVFLLIPLYIDLAAGAGPSVLSMILAAVDIVALFITCRAEFINRNVLLSEVTEKKMRFMICLVSSVLAAALVCLSAFVIYPALEETIENLRERYSSHFLTDLLADLDGNPLNLSDDGLNEGDLSSSGNVVRNGESVFTVTFDKASPYPTYLRGFVGDVYTGERWTTDDAELPVDCLPDKVGFDDIYEGNPSADSLFYRNPYLYYQAVRAGEVTHPAESLNTLTVNKKGFGHIAYFPYFVRGRIRKMSESLPYAFVKDLYVLGTDQDNIEVPYYMIPSLSDALTASAQVGAGAGGGATVRYEQADELLSLLNGRYNAGKTENDLYRKPYDEYVLTDTDGSESHVRLEDASIAAYEAYVETVCTELPEDLDIEEALAEIRAQIAGGASDTAACVAAVQRYLASHCVYTLNPGDTDREKDFVETFLFERKTGYCVHFAASGAVLLRALGIPARYVEGYLVPAANARETVSVTDFEAHAWCEIFIRDFGWFPVDMTPTDAPEQPESETESTPADETQPETTKPPTMPERPPEPPKKPDEPERSLLWLWLLLSLMVLGALGVLIWRHYFRIVPLEELSEGRNTRETYLELYDRLRKSRFTKQPRFCADDSVSEIRELYPEIPEKEIARMQALAKEAFYSENRFGAETVVWLYPYYKNGSFARPAKLPEEQA